jgi:hypothetical protein
MSLVSASSSEGDYQARNMSTSSAIEAVLHETDVKTVRPHQGGNGEPTRHETEPSEKD